MKETEIDNMFSYDLRLFFNTVVSDLFSNNNIHYRTIENNILYHSANTQSRLIFPSSSASTECFIDYRSSPLMR